MWNKKGVSGVVVTLLIVLITIAAGALLVSTVIPFIQNSLSTSTECISYREHFVFAEETGYNCYDVNNMTGFSVRAKYPERDLESLNSFDIVFSADNSLRKSRVNDGDNINPGIEGVRILDRGIVKLNVPKPGEMQTYVYNAGNIRPNKMLIYPVLKSGKICDVSDEIELVSCKGVNLI